MKYLFILLSSVMSLTTMAQSRTTTVEYQKVNRQAIIADVPFPEKTIRDAIDDKMEKMGYKGKDSKGFTVYKGVRMSELGNDSYDLYFMADKKSKKEKESSTVTLLISKGFDSFVADSNDTKVISNAKNYLDTLKNMVADYDLQQQVMAQEDVVKKATKKYAGYIDDAADLEKKRKKIEKDIEDNKKDQADQQAEVDKQKVILDTLRNKRRTS